MTNPNHDPIYQASKEKKTWASFCAAASALCFTCTDTHWLGQEALYHFTCSQGHPFTRRVRTIVDGTAVCAECKNQQRFKQMQQWAQLQGGRCLESGYAERTRHRFVCAQGHEWLTFPHNILYYHQWCPICQKAARPARRVVADGFERIQQLVADKGGQCLSKDYFGLSSPCLLQCAMGHQWQTKAAHLLNGGWCPHCSRQENDGKLRTPNSLARLQYAAKIQGGECLDTVFTKISARYQFRCAKGHEWQAPGWQIMRGTWCVKCLHASMSVGIDRMHEIAKAHGGVCLSEDYVNTSTKLLWQCKMGHQWHATPFSIQKGSWCAACRKLERTNAPTGKTPIDPLGPFDTKQGSRQEHSGASRQN